MVAFATTYKRFYDGVNYRLRTFAGERLADFCRPTSIVISITERCNAKCIHCDIWKNRGPEKGLTGEQWKTTLGQLRRWLGPVQVTFSGGEALMRPVTIDLVRYAVSEGLIVEVLTNGYWKNQERIEQLARANPWRITVSLDGIGDAHSLIRGHEDFFERTAESLATLQRVRDEDRLQFKIRLKTVVMRQNLDEVEEVARYASGKPGVDVFYQPIEQNYNTIDDSRWFENGDNWPADTDRALAVVHNLIRLKRDGFPIANSVSQLEAMALYFRDPQALRVATQNHSAHETRSLCSALTNLEIHSGGDVFTCVRMPAVGNLNDNPIRQIWNQRPRWWRGGCCMQLEDNK